MVPSQQLTVGIIGCGSMGTAIASGMLDAISKDENNSAVQIKKLITTVGTDSSKKRVSSALAGHSDKLDIRIGDKNLTTLQEADIIVLSVKPFKRDSVLQLPGIRETLRGKLLISVMAGIKTSELYKSINGNSTPSESDCQVVRAMPNMAAQIRQAMTLGTTMPLQLSPENSAITQWMFRQIGKFQFISEKDFDIAGVLVGCSGSLMMLAIDGLLDAAVAEGLKRSEAQSLVVDSTIGMLGLLTIGGGHPAVMREKIASPAGSSIQALLELEKQGVRSAFADAIMKASERSRNMSKL